MSQISCIENTLTFGFECALELAVLFGKMVDDLRLVDDFQYVSDGQLNFNTNHDEHQDYLSEARFRKILKKHNAGGKVRFASLEGDTAGQKWSYIFDGEGGCRRTRGRI